MPDHIDPYRDLRTVDLHTISRTDFLSQVRVGKNGKKFKIYKFRSMYMDAEERKKELMKQNRVKDGMMFKLEWDPRIMEPRNFRMVQ